MSSDTPVTGSGGDLTHTNSPRAKLGGIPVLIPDGVSWEMIPGTEPAIMGIDIPSRTQQGLLPPGVSATNLGMTANGMQIKWEKIYCLYQIPSEWPQYDKVLVADQRYWWKHKHVARKYNMHRRVGVKYLQDPTKLLIVDVKDNIKYASYSLYNYEAKWTINQILEDLYQEYKLWASLAGLDVGDIVIPSSVGVLPVENLELDGTFAEAISRALQYMPGYDITVDPNGAVRIYSRVDGGETNYTGKGEGGLDAAGTGIMGHEMYGFGRIIKAHLRRIRPRYIDILFQREFEVRFDSDENTSTTSDSPIEVSRKMKNVLPLPDWTAFVNGHDIAQGTWIGFSEAFVTWGEPPGMKQLGFQQLRRAMVPFMSLWNGFLQNGTGAPDADWGPRVAAMESNYRTTFRLPQNWVSKCINIRAERIAILDPSTGARAISPVYSDWSRIPNDKTLLVNLQATGGHDGSLVTNMIGYPPTGTLTSQVRPAPARVDVLDMEQGIIKYNYQDDQFHNFSVTLPSMVELDGQNTQPGVLPLTSGPTQKLENRQGRSIMWDAIADGNGTGSMIGLAPVLTANHKSFTILTLMPGAPNNNSQYYRLRVNFEDVKSLYTENGYANISEGTGPPMEIKVSQNIATARYAWNDSKAADIERAFLFGGGKGVTPQDGGQDVDDTIADLLINGNKTNSISQPTRPGQQGPPASQKPFTFPDQGPTLYNVGRAIAAATWATMGDRPIGSGSIPFTPAAAKSMIEGYLQNISFEIAANGMARFSVSLPEVVPQIDPMTLMPDSLRKIISRSVVGHPT